MEKILGVIEDLLDKYEQGSKEEQEDAQAELKLNLDQMKQNLQPLIENGNNNAISLLQRLNAIKF